MGCALSVESRHTPRASRSVNNYEGIIAVAASPFHASADRTAAHLETFVDKNKKGMSSTNTTDTINTTANMKTGTKQMAVAKEKVAAVKQMQQEQQAGSGMGRYHRCNKLRVDTSLCDAGRTPCNTEVYIYI